MEIHLPHGHVAIIDDADYAAISGPCWYLNHRGYVVAYANGRMECLHRVIMGANGEQLVDHKNGDKLDNRRSNLRICTHTENMQNRRMHRTNKCGVKGVYLDKGKKTPRYRAQIRVNGECIRLGSFRTLDDAAAAYAAAATKYHGEFARVQ